MTHGDRRKAQILETGLMLWRNDPAAVSARRIGKMLGITHTAVLYHWKTTEQLRNAIADFAIAQRDNIVVPMLIVARHPSAVNISADDKARYLNQL